MLFFCLLNYTNRSRGKGAATCDERLALVKAWQDANIKGVSLSWAVTLAGCTLPLAGRCCFIERKWLLHEAAQVWGFFSWITSACLPKKDISAEFSNMALFWHIKGKAGRSQTFLQSTSNLQNWMTHSNGWTALHDGGKDVDLVWGELPL